MTAPRKEHQWLVATGDTYKSRVMARTPKSAAVAAFTKRPPKYPGKLTRIDRKDGATFYLSTTVILKAAGFVIRDAK